ncbi:MAG: hypothetical protein BMS9Abin26_0535 [Gammaproteobacteria bacterium]|nr:MAG: hypothetical protein BMS9Abin26_0535 [Gammaproteobacteria bacterium]
MRPERERGSAECKPGGVLQCDLSESEVVLNETDEQTREDLIYSSFRRRPESSNRLNVMHWIPGLRYASPGMTGISHSSHNLQFY